MDNKIKEVREERDMLADEARQMNEYLKRLDFLGLIDLDEDSLGWVLGTTYGVDLNKGNE